MKLRKVEYSKEALERNPDLAKNEYAIFWCPGCDGYHQIQTKGEKAWEFNGDYENPTFSPSYVTWLDSGPHAFRCHSYIREGNIQFLNDCTHALKGQTVPLPDVQLQ